MRFILRLSLALLAAPAFAQHGQPQFPQEFPHRKPGTGPGVSDRNDPEACRPDSVLEYWYLSPPDSVLVHKTTWRYYGDEAIVTAYYEPTLDYVDSTVFDAQGRLVLEQTLHFSSNQSVPYTRTLYYPHGNTLHNDSSVYFNTTFATGVFEPHLKTIYTFDANDRPAGQQVFLWNASGETWNKSERRTYAYTPAGKIKEEQRDIWESAAWKPVTLTVYTYGAGDSLAQKISSDWYQNVLEPYQKTVYSHDPAADSWLQTIYGWDDGTWEQTYYILDDRDPQGRRERFEEISFIDSPHGKRIDYFYVHANTSCPWYTIESVGNGQEWILFNKEYYFPGVVGGHDHPPGQWSAYPNPAGDWIWLEAPAGLPVRLLDLAGRTLYTGITKGIERIDLRGAQGACLLVVGEGKAASARLIMAGK